MERVFRKGFIWGKKSWTLLSASCLSSIVPSAGWACLMSSKSPPSIYSQEKSMDLARKMSGHGLCHAISPRKAWDLDWEIGDLGVGAAMVEIWTCSFLARGSILLNHEPQKTGLEQVISEFLFLIGPQLVQADLRLKIFLSPTSSVLELQIHPVYQAQQLSLEFLNGLLSMIKKVHKILWHADGSRGLGGYGSVCLFAKKRRTGLVLVPGSQAVSRKNACWVGGSWAPVIPAQ